MAPPPAFGLFSLFAAFDLIAVFAVYIICLQLMGLPIDSSLSNDVMGYTFQASLFDCVINAAFRMLLLLFVHSIYRSTSIFAVTTTTVTTTAFTIVKVFLYRYPFPEKGNAAFAYILVFANLLSAWVELWIFVVLIHNKQKAVESENTSRTRLSDSSSTVIGIDDPTVHRLRRYGATTVSEQFYSAIGSGSDEDGTVASEHRNKLSSLKEIDDELIMDEKEKAVFSCYEICIRLNDEIFRLAFSEDVAWKQLSGFDDCTLVCVANPSVVSPEFRINAPIFRVVMDFNARFELLRRVLIDEISKMPTWHPFVPESKSLERLDTRKVPNRPFIEITYQTSQPALGGFVSARDFINLRYVGLRDGVIFSSSAGTSHKTSPPRQGYVRGETGPCAYLLVSHTSQYLNKICPQPASSIPLTRFVWLVNSDVKGGLPSSIVNRAMHYAIRRFASDLRTQLANLSSAGVTAESTTINSTNADAFLQSTSCDEPLLIITDEKGQ